MNCHSSPEGLGLLSYSSLGSRHKNVQLHSSKLRCISSDGKPHPNWGLTRYLAYSYALFLTCKLQRPTQCYGPLLLSIIGEARRRETKLKALDGTHTRNPKHQTLSLRDLAEFQTFILSATVNSGHLSSPVNVN